jgi:hypothetical protein
MTGHFPRFARHDARLCHKRLGHDPEIHPAGPGTRNDNTDWDSVLRGSTGSAVMKSLCPLVEF